MTPALTAAIREALDKPLLSEEACRRVVVAVLEGVREPSQGMVDACWGQTRDIPNDERMALLLCDNQSAFKLKAGRRFTAMIDALLSEVR